MPQLVSPASSGIVADTVTVEAGLCERPAGEDVPTDPRGSKTESNRGVHGILWHAGAMAWLRVRNSPMSSLRGKNVAVHAMQLHVPTTFPLVPPANSQSLLGAGSPSALPRPDLGMELYLLCYAQIGVGV